MTTSTEPVIAYVGLGANLGDADGTLRQAVRDLASTPGIELLAASGIWRSAPMGSGADGPDYRNGVVALRTALDPVALLRVLQAIEHTHGRERSYRNAPRTLDLDLLLYGDVQIELREPELIVPHPRLHERAFALRPLAEIAPPSIVLPGIGPLDEALATVLDQDAQRVQGPGLTSPGA